MNPHARASHIPRKYLRKVCFEGERNKCPRAHLLAQSELQNTQQKPLFNNFMLCNALGKMGRPSISVDKSTRAKLMAGPKFQSCEYL